MSCYPLDLLYHREHVWLLQTNDDEAVFGVTYFAQDTLGDIVQLNLPTVGGQVTRGVICGGIESRETTSDLISPLSGVIICINEELKTQPELVNKDPYKDGWIATIKFVNQGELSELMTSSEYMRVIGE